MQAFGIHEGELPQSVDAMLVQLAMHRGAYAAQGLQIFALVIRQVAGQIDIGIRAGYCRVNRCGNSSFRLGDNRANLRSTADA